MLILDTLRVEPHPTHLHLAAALEIIERVQPQRAYLTHVAHNLDYDLCNAILPSGVELAYDGLNLPVRLTQ